MVGYNGVRLIDYLHRRSHSLSSSLFHHPNPKTLIAGGLRSFTAGLGNPITNPNLRNLNLGATRPIHGTAPLSARDYHDVLGVRKNATASEIMKAYFELAKKLHPDTNKHHPKAAKKFQEISRAYEVSKDCAANDQVRSDPSEPKRKSGGSSKDGSDPFKSSNFRNAGHDPFKQKRNNGGFSKDGSDPFKSSNFRNAGHDPFEQKRNNGGFSKDCSGPYKSSNFRNASHDPFEQQGDSYGKSTNPHQGGDDQVEQKRKNSSFSNPFKSVDFHKVRSVAVTVAVVVGLLYALSRGWVEMELEVGVACTGCACQFFDKERFRRMLSKA